MEFKKNYSASKPQTQQPVQSFISLSLEEGTPKKVTWEVKVLIMGKTYSLEDGESLLAELKSTRGKMAEMKGRLERDEITPDEWRQWYAGYKARLDEIKEAVSGMREEVSRRDADLEHQIRERAAELNMTTEEYKECINSLSVCSVT